jgi:hypothetical protein
MSDGHQADLSSISPVIGVFIKALILAERAGATEIGVDHLLAALEFPLVGDEPVAPAPGPVVHTPHREKALSPEAESAVRAAGGGIPLGFEGLTIESLRKALLAEKGEGED